jgi:phage shock protein PspC (stress-responsive transcriptional regulator)
MQGRLERSTTNRIVGGICGGIAEYLQVDATLVRVFFVIVILLTAGFAILGYIALLFLIPLPGQSAPFVRGSGATPAGPSAGATDAPAQSASTDDTVVMKQPAPPPTPEDPAVTERRRAIFGYFLVGLGALFLLSNLGAFRLVRGDLLWPLVLVAAGVFIIAQRVRS